MSKKNVEKKKITCNEVYAWILLVLMVFWTVASGFGIAGFIRSGDKKDNVVTASAETADSVEHGQSYLRISPEFVFYVAGEGLDPAYRQDEYWAILSLDNNNYWFLFRIGIGRYDDGSVPIDTPYSYMAVDDVGDLVVTETFYLPVNTDFRWNNPEITLSLYDITDFSLVAQYYRDTSDDGPGFFSLAYINRLENSVEDAYEQGYRDGLSVGREEGTSGDFEDGYQAGKTYGWNSGYSQGKQDGLKDGKLLGKNEGYELGKEDGILIGKDIGFAEGVASANDYSFMSLMSSVIDAPVQAFRGLFNFELLGVNLANFALAMLSLCAVLAVIRVVL